MSRVKGANFTKSERRTTILKAALKVFCTTGYSAACIDDIAAQAACSHGLVYFYFKNKEEIFCALVEESVAHAEQMKQTFLKHGDLSAVDFFQLVTQKILELLIQKEEFMYHYQFSNLIQLLKKDLPKMGITLPTFVPFFSIKEYVERGQAEGTVVLGDSTALTTLYLSTLQGLAVVKAFAAQNADQPFCLPKAEDVLRMILKERS